MSTQQFSDINNIVGTYFQVIEFSEQNIQKQVDCKRSYRGYAENEESKNYS